jgi:hypothetical protein
MVGHGLAGRTKATGLVLLLATPVLLATTAIVTVPTPKGGVSEGVYGSLVILGAKEQVLTSQDEYALVEYDVPPGTEVLTPVSTGWLLALVQVKDRAAWEQCFRDALAPECPMVVERAYGFGWSYGFAAHVVDRLEPVDDATTPPSQSASLVERVGMLPVTGSGFSHETAAIADLMFVGTPPESVGPPGAPGALGAKGSQGMTGDAGMPGDKGVVGDPGVTGPPGITALVLAGGSSNPVNGNGTTFVPALYNDVSPTEPPVLQELPLAGTLSALSIRLSIAPNPTITFTVRRNGADTPVACSVSAPATTCQNTANTVVFNAGDTIALRATGTSSTSPRVRWSAQYAPQ